jgi:hypothetical protein
MIISTYAALLAQVADWSHRADLVARVPGFIEVAERELFRELSLRSIEASTSGTTSGATIAIPTGLSSFERIKINAAGHEFTLNYSSPNGIAVLTSAPGCPFRFLLEDGAIRLLPAPGGAYSYTIYYIPELSALSASNTSNWLLANHADLYLKAALLQVAKFANNQPDVVRLEREVAVALDSIKRADERKRFPIAGGLQIKPRSYR